METLAQLAALIRRRNQLEQEITALIGRPAQLGHLGEYIAAHTFDIVLEQSAAQKGFDGRFADGPLQGRTVNIKWYAVRQSILDINTSAPPEYFLVLTGPKSAMLSSRNQTRPWRIDHVFIFDASQLIEHLQQSGVVIGVATSVRKLWWDAAEIFPQPRCPLLLLSDAQCAMLKLFGSTIDA